MARYSKKANSTAQYINENQIGITAVVTTFNEEQNIERCLRSIQWTDEVLVIDSFSTDKTTAIL